MQIQTLLPAPRLIRVETILASDAGITLVAQPVQPQAACPHCGHLATRVHSRYWRRVADLPWNGIPVQLQVRARRFFCEQPQCPTRIFAEPLPAVAPRYARRTVRL